MTATIADDGRPRTPKRSWSFLSDIISSSNAKDEEVEPGQVWKVFPELSTIQVCRRKHYEKGHSLSIGVISQDGYFQHGAGFSIVWPKVYVGKDGNITSFATRPGLLLGAVMTIKDYSRVLAVPGCSPKNKKAEKHEMVLPIRFSKSSGMKYKRGFYYFINIWSIQTAVGYELLNLMCKPDGYLVSTASSRVESKKVLRDTLRTALGLSGRYIPESECPFMQGEIVFVDFQNEEPRVPCLVISDDAIHCHIYKPLIVLQMIPTKVHHETSDTVIPLALGEDFEQDYGAMSVDLTLVRGIRQKSAKRFSPTPLYFRDDDLWKGITESLEDLYVSPA